jgi:DNA-binding transcriptional regulator YbjK
LVSSALRVVASGGLRALTHRAVDAEAGVPEGSCSSYFRTRLALLTALTDQVGHLLTLEVLDLAQRLKEAEARVGVDDEARREVVIDEIVSLFARLLSAPELVLVQAELGLEAQRQPELQAVLGAWRTGLFHIVEAIVRNAGKSEPSQRAMTLVAAMEGVVLAGLQQPAADRTAYLTTATTMLLSGLY